MQTTRSTCFPIFALISLLQIAPASAAPTGLHDALAAPSLGLYRTADFRLSDGSCTDCQTIPQALWYFKNEIIAVPEHNSVGFSPALTVQEDVKRSAITWQGQGEKKLPPLIWVGAPQRIEGGKIDARGSQISTPSGHTYAFSTIPKLASNRSYFNAESLDHLAGRPLVVRGKVEKDQFIARTLWPEDYRLSNANTAIKPLTAEEDIASLVRSANIGKRQMLSARVLWQRDSSTEADWFEKPVLAFVLNGAQGDDDEAHGGHFAIATGRFGPEGQWDNWLVNNFYNLDAVSEKGIVAATLPMDAYMTDLNSGQAWYRPSYMLVAVLRDERVPRLFQESISRVFNHFYRHDFSYRHATANCAGISIETLRSLGWNIPKRGSTSMLKAIAGMPYMTLKDGSLDSGRKAYDYMAAELTNLYPFAAFEAAGQDILTRIAMHRSLADQHSLEHLLAEDIEALIYVSIPQLPSSRAFGQAPVMSFEEYMSRVPEDRAEWKVIPVPPRDFPHELKDATAPREDFPPSYFASAAYAGLLSFTGLYYWRRRNLRKSNNNFLEERS